MKALPHKFPLALGVGVLYNEVTGRIWSTPFAYYRGQYCILVYRAQEDLEAVEKPLSPGWTLLANKNAHGYHDLSCREGH